jgi:hypothetical protein
MPFVMKQFFSKYFSKWTDRLGYGVSLVCALHCALVPVAVAAVPSMGVAEWMGHGFDMVFAVFASLLALASMWQGYRKHRIYRALSLLLPGLLVMWGTVLYSPLHDDVILHAVLMTFGGTLIGVAHMINLRLSHGHVHDACCAHSH